MSGRLIITMDYELYVRLKKKAPSQNLSAFVTEAVRVKLFPDAKALNAAYQAASKEQWRVGVAEDWKYVD